MKNSFIAIFQCNHQVAIAYIKKSTNAAMFNMVNKEF